MYILGSFYSNRFPNNIFKVFKVRYHFLYFLLCHFIPIPFNPFSFLPLYHMIYIFPSPLKSSPVVPYKCPDLLNYESCRQMDGRGNNCSHCTNPDPEKQGLQAFVCSKVDVGFESLEICVLAAVPFKGGQLLRHRGGEFEGRES